jgi:hypothetical protein
LARGIQTHILVVEIVGMDPVVDVVGIDPGEVVV